MTEKERIENPGESFDGGYHLYARERYKERVKKTPDRIEFAKTQLDKNKIKYKLHSGAGGHFHCWRQSDGKLFQFWAGTGKILGYENRGIHLLIRELLK